MLLEESSVYTQEMLEAKNNYILKMATKLQNSRLLQKYTRLPK